MQYLCLNMQELLHKNALFGLFISVKKGTVLEPGYPVLGPVWNRNPGVPNTRFFGHLIWEEWGMNARNITLSTYLLRNETHATPLAIHSCSVETTEMKVVLSR